MKIWCKIKVITYPFLHVMTIHGMKFNFNNKYLFKMDNFEKCLEDIEAALQFGYPHNMRFKLLDRQENIFNTNKIT